MTTHIVYFMFPSAPPSTLPTGCTRLYCNCGLMTWFLLD